MRRVVAAGTLGAAIWLAFGAAAGLAAESPPPVPDAPKPAAAPLPPVVPVDAPAVLRAVRAAGGQVVLVNVWATWCGPCREELPDLVRLRRDLWDLGVRIVLVSDDRPDDRDAAARFLGDRGVDFQTYIKVGDDQSFIAGLAPGWSGALPATFMFDGAGRLLARHEGQLDYQAFKTLALNARDVVVRGS